MNFITIKELNTDILNNLYKIPKDIDLIVGIPRSGMIVASLLAVYLNKPLTDIDSYISGNIYLTGSTKNTSKHAKSILEVKRALIVEDSSCYGRSIKMAKEKLAVQKYDIQNVFYAAYVTEETKDVVDIFLRVVDLPRTFEWNYLHTDVLNKSCVDLDGVLCVDPAESENDDGVRYKEFIINAKPKFIPTKKIGWIVTARLEKYRSLTEKWLSENNIEYDKLIMMTGVKSAKERRQLNCHASFKGEVYKSLNGAILFIESDQNQAREISEISHKDVICVSDSSYFEAGILTKVRYRIFRKMVYIIKSIVPEKLFVFFKKKWNSLR